jgi:MFS family permease
MPWPPRRVYYGWVVVVVLGLTGAISFGSTQYLFSVLLVPMERELGWGAGTLSGAYAAGLVVAAVMAVPAGRLADARGPRALTSVGAGVTGVSLVLLSRCTEVWQLYLIWGGGIGAGMALTLYPIAFTAITNWFERRRTSALTLLTLLSGGLSTPVFLPLAGAAIEHAGWRAAVLVLGVLKLAVALPLRALLLRRRPEDHGLAPDGGRPAPSRGAEVAPGLTRAQAMATGSFWLLTVSGALGLAGDTIVTSQQVAYLLGRGIPAVAAATAAGAIGAVGLPARLLLSVVAGRVSSGTALTLGLVAQAVGAAALLAVGPRSGWAVWAYAVLYGASRAVVVPLRAAVLGERFGRREYGLITAWQSLLVTVPGAVGPLLAGAAYDRLRSYVPALVLAAIALAAAAVTARKA